MSGAFVNPGLVDLIAQSIDITKLSSEAAKALAPDVEYKLRELIQVRAELPSRRRSVRPPFTSPT